MVRLISFFKCIRLFSDVVCRVFRLPGTLQFMCRDGTKSFFSIVQGIQSTVDIILVHFKCSMVL